MPSRAPVLVLVSAYLLSASLVLLGWFEARGGTWWPLSIVLGVAPTSAYLLIALRERTRTQLLAKSAVCFAFLPVLLLIWSASYVHDLPAVEHGTEGARQVVPVAEPVGAPGDLDAARLFAGALGTQDLPLAYPGIVFARVGAFADGSELSLLRFAGQAEAQRYLAFMRSAQQGSAAALAGRSGVHLALTAPRYAYVEAHGRELLQVKARDEAEVLARLQAQAVPTPPAPSALSAVSAAEPSTTATTTTTMIPTTSTSTITVAANAAAAAPIWPFALGYSLGHALAFVLFIGWAGTRTTRVAAELGAQRVTATRLRSRLASLAELPAPWRVSVDGEAEVIVEYRFPSDVPRAHRVLLVIDERTREVRVRERVSADGAKPKDARERDMRSIGGPRFDIKRPDARKVWARIAQTSILEPEQLQAVPLELHGDRVVLPDDYARALDTDQMIHVLCVLITRSGYAFAPVFFARS